MTDCKNTLPQFSINAEKNWELASQNVVPKKANIFGFKVAEDGEMRGSVENWIEFLQKLVRGLSWRRRLRSD